MNRLRAIIIGLGNHASVASKSIKSRHSVGMAICNALAQKHNGEWAYESSLKAYVTYVCWNDCHVMLMKSKYPMNLNGRSLLKAARKYEIASENIVVLHDDLDRRLGKLSWKLDGSAGGHNGVKSVISSLHTDKFNRLRIGIGRPVSRDHVTEYVLGNFNPEEYRILEGFIDHFLLEIENYLSAKFNIQVESSDKEENVK